MKLDIMTTTVSQTANEILGTKEKNLYYLIITNSKKEKLVINVGEKTHNSVKELITTEEKLEQIQKEADEEIKRITEKETSLKTGGKK